MTKEERQEIMLELDCMAEIIEDVWDGIANVRQLVRDAYHSDQVAAAAVPVIGAAADGPRKEDRHDVPHNPTAAAGSVGADPRA